MPIYERLHNGKNSGDSAAITPILMEIVFKETLNGLTLKKKQ